MTQTRRRKLKIFIIGSLLSLAGAGCFPYNTRCASGDVACNFAFAALYLSNTATPPCSGAGASFTSFHSYLSSGLDLEGRALCATKDGGLIAAGVTNTGVTLQGRAPLIPHSGSLGDALVVKWDANGAVVWFTYLGTGASSLNFDRIAETSDGGIVLLGYMNGPDNFVIGGIGPILPATFGDDTDIYLARLRADGSLGWHTALGGGGAGNEYDAGDLVVASDGSIYLCGTGGAGAPTNMGVTVARVPFTTGDNNNILFAKLSDAGELLWFRYIGGGGTGASYFGYDLTQTADGNFVISGDASSAPSNTIDGRTAILPYNVGDDRNALTLKVDPEGDLLWFTYLGGGGPGYTYSNRAIAAHSDGSTVLVGDAEPTGVSVIGGVTALYPYGAGNLQNGLVWRLDSAGGLQWFTYLGGGSGAYRLNDISRSTDGRFVIAGTIQNGTSTMGGVSAVAPDEPSVNSAFLAKLTPLGNLEWFTYASGGSGSYYGMANVTGAVGGGLVAVGVAQNGSAAMQGKAPLNAFNVGDTYNMFLLKLDAGGRL